MELMLAALLERVETLEHVRAIEDLKARYWSLMDRMQLDDVRECFVAEGAIVDFQGVPYCDDRDKFLSIVREQGGRPGVHNAHHGQNPRIAITGRDTASGVWDVYFSSIDVPNRITIQMTGGYDDRYVLKDGRWLIRSTQFRQSSFLMQKIDEAGQPAIISLGEQDLHAFRQ